MEDVLVGSEIVDVGGHGTLQLELDMIANVGISRLTESPFAIIAGLLDLLGYGGDSFLGLDDDIVLSGGIQHDQGNRIGVSALLCLGNQVIALTHVGESLVSRDGVRLQGTNLRPHLVGKCTNGGGVILSAEAVQIVQNLLIGETIIVFVSASACKRSLQGGSVLLIDGVAVVVAIGVVFLTGAVRIVGLQAGRQIQNAERLILITGTVDGNLCAVCKRRENRANRKGSCEDGTKKFTLVHK